MTRASKYAPLNFNIGSSPAISESLEDLFDLISLVHITSLTFSRVN